MNDNDDDLKGRVQKLEQRADKTEADVRGHTEQIGWLRKL